MKKLLLNCDQVFDVLTRGPFPSGDPIDDSVEHHLRACHECRNLAEALRPAVAVLHEAVSAEQATDLPEYQGSLPLARPLLRKLSVERLSGPPRGSSLVGRPAARPLAREHTQSNSVRFIAATLLVVGLATWLWALVRGAQPLRPAAPIAQVMDSGWSPPRDGQPVSAGLLTLANLRLPAACLPLSHRPLSPEHAAELALELHDGKLAGLQCCTECHHAGQPKGGIRAAAVARTTQEHCQVCHRG